MNELGGYSFDVDYITRGDAEDSRTATVVAPDVANAVDIVRGWYEARGEIVFRMRDSQTGKTVYLAKGQDW